MGASCVPQEGTEPPAPGCSRAGLCHGPATQAQPVPCPGQPCCALVPPSGPARPAQGTEGTAGTKSPRDGPSLTVPVTRVPSWGTAGPEECGGLGRVPGEVKPGTGMGSSPPVCQPSPATGQSSAGTALSPSPRSTQVPARTEPSLLLQSQSCSGRAGEGTRRNEGEPQRAESPRGEPSSPDPPSACAKVGGGRKTN